MSWLFFLDESGHDHKNTPFEVRGGIALKDNRIWPFIRQIKELEIALFGREMINYGKEIKGERLLNRERYKMSRKAILDPVTRRTLCNSLLNKSGKNPKGYELVAYHQTCIEFAQKIMQILLDNNAVIFASLIPKGTKKPSGMIDCNFLRKDLVFLFERYFYFLEREDEYGLIIMDETDKKEDISFVTRLHKYFTLTANGRYRTSRIIPVPLFVSSDMSYPVQVADVCIYCINWGFRLKYYSHAEYRREIADEFGPSIARLQYKGSISVEDQQRDIYGIVYVPDPYTSRD
jgi:hypothetical protein